MELSVHIVTCGRLELLKQCCRSVAAAIGESAEVVVIINGECPGVLEWLLDFNHSQFRWVLVRRESLSRSRNRAFKICLGKIFYFLDDDVTVPTTLFKLALDKFYQDPSLAILGGPNLTPPLSPWKERLFGAVMTSPFAAPMVRKRYTPGKNADVRANEHHLIFCNLACRAVLIPEGIRFREDLVSNQENLFLFLSQERGLKAFVSSELYVYHRRRKDLRGFVLQVASYGCGRYQQTRVLWKSSHPFFYAPALLWPVLIFLILSGQFRFLAIIANIYLCLAILGAVFSKEIRKLGVRAVMATLPLTLVVHLAYGAGWWRGLWAQLISSAR